MKISLTRDQKIALETRHKKERDARICDRIKAVLLSSEGWKAKAIAQALRLHEETILQHIRDYKTSEKLKTENGGSKSRLSEEQTKSLVEYLSEHTYKHQYEIVEYINTTFNINFSISGMTKWLKRNKFVYKKPKPIPHKFNHEAQELFKQYYQELKQLITDDEHILFMDSVHPTQATKLSYGWIRKGTDKTIETTGSRTRVNLVGIIELDNISNAVVNEYEKVNGDTIVEFFNEIRNTYPLEHKLHIILDGAGYHKAHHVQAAAINLNIKLHYLPPYSPNLNPIERLWKVMNEHVRNNRYFPTKQDFRDTILKFFRDILPKIGNSLNTRINDNFQTLKQVS